MLDFDFRSIIARKRDGKKLTADEIKGFIENYLKRKIPDYAASAFLMAIFLNGMDFEETTHFTLAMMKSGRLLNFSDIPKIKVDKHSTGGVGDKVSLILAPLLAACDLAVPMVSGRTLGHTGGTLDKLSSIPNFRTNLSFEECRQAIKEIGLFITGQSEEFVPADKYLYALRDVTATVESIPLIAASIMSKKLAEGIDVLILDIKTGNGAFMEKLSQAQKLAKTMLSIGQLMKKKVGAFITDMNQPLGEAVGNSLEVIEAIEALKGNMPKDLEIITYALAKKALLLTKRAKDETLAEKLVEKAISSGRALEKFKAMVRMQGGDERVVDDYTLFPKAKYKIMHSAQKDGYITEILTKEVGLLVNFLGAQRTKIEDKIDLAVGFLFKKKVGAKVEKGEILVEIHSNDKKKGLKAKEKLAKIIKIGQKKSGLKSLIYGYYEN